MQRNTYTEAEYLSFGIEVCEENGCMVVGCSNANCQKPAQDGKPDCKDCTTNSN